MKDNTSIERVILGSVLLDNTLWREAKELREQDFSLSAHQRIFRTMRDLHDAGTAIDMVTLAESFDRHEEIESIGGVAYLSSLIDGVPERPSIAHYVAIIKDDARRRRAAKTGETLQRLARDGSANIGRNNRRSRAVCCRS